MLTQVFCPTFKFASFIFFILCVNLVLFIAMVVVNESENCKFSKYSFLGVDPYILQMFGAVLAPQLKVNVELWRLLVAPFLNQGFLQLFGSSICMLITGFFVESLVGPLRIIPIFFASAIGGLMMGTACVPDVLYAGFSSMGFIAAILAFVVMNWVALERQKEMRCCLLGVTIFASVFWTLRALAN